MPANNEIIPFFPLQAKSLFETDENNFLRNLTKDGIYYDTRNKRFLLSADATRLAQLTKNIKNTTSRDSTLELAALKSNITKREVILDTDPDIVSKMGGKEAQLEQEKVEKAEEVYRFARQVLDIVDDQDHSLKTIVKRGIHNEAIEDHRTTAAAGIKGIWAGLGSIPEFVPELVRRDAPDTEELKMKKKKQPHTMSLQEIRQKRDEFNSNSARNPKRELTIIEDKVKDHQHLSSKEKRSDPPQQQQQQQQHVESPLSVTETGSLGTVNFREVRKDTITNEAEEEVHYEKAKRQDATEDNEIINRMSAPTTSNDGKVIFAFDEVKELLPARLSQIEAKGEVTLLQPQTITETRYDDVDKDLSESMLVTRENIPASPIGNAATLNAQLYPETAATSLRKSAQKNKIPILKKEIRIGPAQFSKYRSNYERPRNEQMQRWINETMLHPLGNEQTEETDAALQKLNLASLNATTPYPSYTDSKGETSSEYLAKNLQEKVKIEENNNEVGIDELNRDILKEQEKYKIYLENQRLERLREQQKSQNGDDSETQSQSTQNLSSSPSSVKQQPQQQQISKENEMADMERVHSQNNNTSSKQQQKSQPQPQQVTNEEGNLEHFERVHNRSTINNDTSPKPNPTTSTTTPATPGATLPTTIATTLMVSTITTTTVNATRTTKAVENTTVTVNTTQTPPSTTISPPTATPNNLTSNATGLKEQKINNTSPTPENHQDNSSTILPQRVSVAEKNVTLTNRDSVEAVANGQEQQTTASSAQQYLDAWQQGNVTNLPPPPPPSPPATAISPVPLQTPTVSTSTVSHEIQNKVLPYPLDTEYEMELPRNKSAPNILPRSNGKIILKT